MMAETKTHILVLDQGTTSSRAVLFDRQGNLRGVAQEEFRQIFPRQGWVEHDPLDIWNSQLACARRVLTECALSPAKVAAIGITNQRETTLVWERASGKPVGNAIVWQDRRTAKRCTELVDEGFRETLQARTGLLPDPYFSGTKLEWILNQDHDLRKRAFNGELLFGTVDTWLIWKLTGGQHHLTDATNASRTLLFNIHEQDWDPDLLDLFEIPRCMLSKVLDSSADFGLTSADLFGLPIPISGVAGDQQAALFGQLCLEPGMAKNTYGTGCFMIMNTGERAIQSTQNLLTTLAWRLNGKVTYALEGSIFMGGAVVQWLRDGLGIIPDAPSVEALAASVNDHGGVYFVPAFTGLGAPHWDPTATGTIIGLSRGSTAAHVARAALESIAFQSYDVLKAMETDAGFELKELRVDGGAAANNLLMQFQADVLQRPVNRPLNLESTALGAGFLAGLQAGFWPDLNSLRDIRKTDTILRPRSGSERMADRLHEWNAAVARTKHWQS